MAKSKTEHKGVCVVKVSGKIFAVRVKDSFGKNIIEIPPRAYLRRNIKPPLALLPDCNST
jgi:hypothetical protein